MIIKNKVQKKLTKKDLNYLLILSKQFPTIENAITEIINLNAILNLPKETEHFISDLHGEYEAFIHVKNNASGEVKRKIETFFEDKLSSEERKEFANLIYYPKEKLDRVLKEFKSDIERINWYKETLYNLILFCRYVSSKYTRSKVRKALPQNFSYIIDELLNEDREKRHKKKYYNSIIEAIIELNKANEFIITLSELIKRFIVGRVHVLGDIFDRGPGADIIMEELINYHSVDITWGNHDILWIGAASGNPACIANVIRISLRYGNLDTLREGYGIDLLPLATFALDFYKEDKALKFVPKVKDDEFSKSEIDLITKMHKAITIIQFKLEGQLIKKRPEFEMEDRLLLDKIDYNNYRVKINGKDYELNDKFFPTIDPNDPYKLTNEENKVVEKLIASFINSERLAKHARFLLSNGEIILKYNGNLLFHGCIPMTKEGKFKKYFVEGKELDFKQFIMLLSKHVRTGFFSNNKEEKEYGGDIMWYLWCGPASPLFGKYAMKTFERYFIDDKDTHKEEKNPYYEFREDEGVAKEILKMFDLNEEKGHIINGHMPVKVKKGESPVKANGRLINIDGGFSKAYQSETGIAGYTLIFNSREYVLGVHKPFESLKKAIYEGYDSIPDTLVIERLNRRLYIKDTDIGKELKIQIEDLKNLIEAYTLGLIKEKDKKN
ncbi:MAG: fructose-1,6-bisphosphatase [Spirochaetes bacterium]|nr:fructose-1,6-bisphosphatase [Spirochaetota bacterium]